ncbi:crossover junction endonuclease MUS81 [Entomortierella parvispora]|uniref:Crossover junction endonuclease MUS81 n=1 Tax=Entomortierella parvispora TaxID=205924 RepID=A0A9P3H1C0_9FUNG|nr:crossover junction endonuclease MUS81 [Entomortierella parvispora]
MQCGNPQYLGWIEEWMEHARENNNKSYYIYRKAHESMAKYPTRFQHPSEALCLAGVGPKIVGMLESKLAAYCVENDIPMPTPRKGKAKAKAKADALAFQEEEELAEARKPAKKARVQKQYVPTFRSGSYAILLALLDVTTGYGEGCLTKHEITTKGQVYCDASLTNPERGKFYTAWSSMKTLLGKNLVYQNGTKYFLTREGIEIAKGMKAVAGDTDRAIRRSPSYDEDDMEDLRDAPATISRQLSKTAGTSEPKWGAQDHNSAASSSGSRLGSHSSNTITGDHQIFDAWDNDYYDYNDNDNGFSYDNDDNFGASSSIQSTSWKSNDSRPSVGDLHQHVNLISDSEDSDKYKPGAAASFSLDNSYRTHAASMTKRSNGLERAPTVVLPKRDLLPHHSADRPRASSLTSQPLARMALSKHNPFTHLRTTSFSPSDGPTSFAVDIAKLAKFQPVIFRPGTFEVCLVLDIREVRAQNDRDYLTEKLNDRGVNVVKRALDIGDMTWIARLHNPSLEGTDEVVLDYIVERKRMDDLVASIKDGRYTEQKFRLRRSGVDHVIYLVETYKAGETYDVGMEALRTAMTSSQVQDGFFLKRTNNTDQTIDYLVSVTKALKRMHLDQTLYAIPDEAVDRSNYLELQKHLREQYPDRVYLTSYRAFGTLNGKSDSLVVRDVFVKMLMTIRGISEEKAAEIAKTFGTPRALFSQLDDNSGLKTQAERRKVLTLSGSSIGRKKIGPALSAKVADIWFSDEYS